MKKTILIIEDEIAIQEILTEPLRMCGYEVITAEDGLEGISIFRTHPIDLILLDIMLPKINGYVVCEMVRKESQVPIILLTALDTEEDQIKGFDLLADDYITKPFSIKLMLKRVEALFRRAEAADMDTDTIRYKELQISAKQRQVLVSGAEVILTQSEFDILLLLLKNQGRVFTRDEMLNLVWGYEFIGEEKSVNFHIMNLRKKLGVDYIETVRGVGYKVAQENQ
jgi:two-component system response regulator VanR